MSRLLHIVASICARRFMEWRRAHQPMSAVGAGTKWRRSSPPSSSWMPAVGAGDGASEALLPGCCCAHTGRGHRGALLEAAAGGAGAGALLLEAAASGGAVWTKTPPFRRICAFSSCSSKRLYGKHLFSEARCSSFSIKDEELKRFCPARWNGAFLQMRAGVCGTDLAPPSDLLHSASSSRRESGATCRHRRAPRIRCAPSQ